MSDSIWKKEISFSRKQKAPKETPAPAAEVTDAPKQSLLKKEISFSRKPKEPKAPKAAKEPKAAAEPKQSIWKKDLSLSRGKKQDAQPADDAVARLVEAATRTVAPDFAPPVVSEPLAPPTQLAEAVVAAQTRAEVEPAPEPVVAETHPVEVLAVDEPVAVEPPVVAEPPVPAPLTVVPEPAPVEPLALAPDPVSVEPVPVEPVAVEPVAVEPQPVAPQPVAPLPQPVAYHVEPGPVEAWMEPAPETPDPWAAAPELPPTAEADTAVVVHPPVPAAELPPLPAAAATPFWKKELSFSRKPTAAPAPKAAKQPFWKKELSRSRKSEAPLVVPEGIHPPVPAAELPPLPQAKVPFWKKELSFGGGKTPKAPKAEKPAKAAKAAAPSRGLSLPTLSLPSLSLPSRSRGGGKGGHHQVKRLVGLKVGGSQLAAARIANNGAAELLQVARADLEPGVVVAGELRDPDSLAVALKAFFAANKLPRKNVRLGIASNRIGVRTFDIAGIEDAKQLENAIHFRAQEALPIPLDEAVLDYHILEESVDDEGNATKRVLLVVAYRELVDRYVSACKKAGITLSGIDLEAFALLRALSAPRSADQPGDSALVAVAIGHDRSTFAVSDGRVCEFTRVLEWGGASLNVAIARALDLAPSEAEGIKRVVSLASNEVPEGLRPEQYALALDAVRKQVQTFARELVSSLQFYQNQPGSLGIGEIVITGGTASLVGLADELGRLIGVRVRVGDPLARLKITKKLPLDEQVGSLAVAIGLGIED